MSASTSSASYFQGLSLEQVIEDLSSRFIVNLPAEELESIERVCFQIEQAHWYYEDFVRPQASQLPSLPLRKFATLVFQLCPLLSDYDPVEAYDQFMRYKERVPVCGAIVISESWQKCLVVKGYKAGASWSFPRGKINAGESERDCAVREVWEETGYDISPHFNSSVRSHDPDSQHCPPPLPDGDYPEDDWIEIMMKEQRIRMYIVTGVSEDTLFETKTRKEISRIAWSPLVDLPTWSKKPRPGKKDLKCYMVTPFVSALKAWINERKPTKKNKKNGTSVKNGISEGDSGQEDSTGVDLSQPTQDNSDEIAAQTAALQELFFGNSPAIKSPRQAFEPTTTPATKSPKAVQPAAFTQIPSQPVSPTRPSQALSNSLPSIQANLASPKPHYPNGDSLLRLLHQSALASQAQQGASSQGTINGLFAAAPSGPSQPSSHTNGTTTIAPSTVHPSPWQNPISSVVSPSFTDYRESGLSPSTFAPTLPHQPAHAAPVGETRAPAFTDLERDLARQSLLDQLASQLGGGPTPPSPDSPDFISDVDDDEGVAEESAGQVHNFLEIFRSQLAGDGSGRQFGEMKLTNSVMKRLEEEQQAKQMQQANGHVPMQDIAPAPNGVEDSMHPTSRQQIMEMLQGKQQGLQLGQVQPSVHTGATHPPQNMQPQMRIPPVLPVLPLSPHVQASNSLSAQNPLPAPPPQLQNGHHQEHKTQLLSLFSQGQVSHNQPQAAMQPPPASKQEHAAGLLSMFNGPAPPKQFLTHGAPLPKKSMPNLQQHTQYPQQQYQPPSFPPEFANGDRLREFQALMQGAPNGHTPNLAHPRPSPAALVSGNNDLARLFANASR